ncbi:MAG: oxygen-independent coproporphyrinogen III oxidase [Alphaproteobacteria bacterium]|jgi:oxygen-independent coproporphyrinogen III oxidase|nr:oxygen-independent coproporphyrinogen III oxidase [Alphaproteobacteria bacterium]MBT7941878.1 oxygen-independent coproporphyrinogen III oxidase [Alphaproteobacteria bacterium]
MEQQLLEKYDAPVPRYTSYPTAPNFQTGISGETYAGWLAEVGANDTMSLYFHVPFCAAMCWYCGCHTKVVKRYEPISDYAATMAREVELVADALTAAPTVVHVHWGGGTPTMLSADDFSRLMDTARERFRFAEHADIAVEIDPRTLTRDMAGALAQAGVTRASLGVQDFNVHVQEAINRVQPYEVTENAVHWLREAGIDAINFDLMYGLPNQTIEDVVRSVEMAYTLEPNRLALFGYAHVPWMKSHQKMINTDALADGPERMAQVEAAAEHLTELGYRAIGLDHFALPDDALSLAADDNRLKRNFQGYTTDEGQTLLGFGVSAIGSLAGGYVQNETANGAYGRAVNSGRLPIVRGIELTNDDRLRRAIIEQLMCGQAADLNALAEDYGIVEPFAAEHAALAPLINDGLAELNDGVVHITKKGRPLMRMVAAVFDRYLATGEGRHSRAV